MRKLHYKIAPANFYEGKNILSDRKLINSLNHSPSAILIDKKIEQKLYKHLKTLQAISSATIYFNGECSLKEVSRISTELKKKFIKTLFALGGGKLIDTAKLASEKSNAGLITIPTSAATCAAWTSIAPTYRDNGEKLKTFELKKSPYCCIIDYEILINQPKRLLVSGIADALAKYFETRAYIDSNPAIAKMPSVATAYHLSCEIHENIKRYSQEAIKHLITKKISTQFEKIIYTNIVLAGLVSEIGGKYCRSLAAHSLYNGLTFIKELRKFLHGEKVGWGILVQLVLEKKFDELKALREFFKTIGSPVSLKQLGWKKKLNFKDLRKAVEMAIAPDENIRLLKKDIDAQTLWQAIKFVEELQP